MCIRDRVAIFYATDENGERKENAPTVYLLNGAGGSEQDTDWVAQAYDELENTYKDSGANVVIPMEGAFSYYVDWAAEPPVDTDTNPFFHGKQMWSTFLAHELPQAVEPYMKAERSTARWPACPWPRPPCCFWRSTTRVSTTLWAPSPAARRRPRRFLGSS